MLWDLELDIEERFGVNLISARRLRLADIHIPDLTAPTIKLSLPTAGLGLNRRIRLFDRSGFLLDGSETFFLIEKVILNLRINGETSTFEMGDSTEAIVETKLRRLDDVDEQFAQLLEDGVANRVIPRGASTGIRVLKDRLGAAQGELLVFDPYFDDWSVLKDVLIPIRVLTGKDKRKPNSSDGLQSTSIAVKQWAGTMPTPEFHDRCYLWRGGGVTVGTSPGGLGKRLSMIDTLAPAVVSALTASFNSWWSDPDFV